MVLRDVVRLQWLHVVVLQLQRAHAATEQQWQCVIEMRPCGCDKNLNLIAVVAYMIVTPRSAGHLTSMPYIYGYVLVKVYIYMS